MNLSVFGGIDRGISHPSMLSALNEPVQVIYLYNVLRHAEDF